MQLPAEADKMELYFHPMSGCSRRVLALLAHLEVPFTPKVVDLNAGAQAKPPYLAINPGGRVPTLVEGSRNLWESTAILRRLAREYAPALLGEGPEEDEVNRWLAWTLCHLSPALSRLNAETGLKRMRGEAVDPEAVSAALAHLTPLLKLLNTHLDSNRYLAGDRATLAEFACAPSIEASSKIAQLSLSEHPAVERWLADTQAIDRWPAEVGGRP